MPTDDELQDRIETLEQEQHHLREREGEPEPDPTLEQDAARIEEIRVDLEVLWDLLRQRRALREAGEDPEGAAPRSPETIERYWQ
jgi:hypothetical protein